MKRALLLTLPLMLCLGALYAAGPDSDKPQFTNDNKLVKPENYREWVYLSSGLGMSYSSAGSDHPQFTNVFVPKWAYDEFLKSGKWPEQTMWVVEERASETQGLDRKGRALPVRFRGHGGRSKRLQALSR